MKKILHTLLLIILPMIGLTTLSSCDEDVDRSIILSGQWTGDFKMYYSDGYGNTFDAIYSDIQLIPDYDYATHGTGQEVDFFDNRPYGYDQYNRPIYCPLRYQTFYFTWRVQDGYIYLHYPYNSSLDVAIYDYRLNSNRFCGYFGDSRTFFDLRKLEDFYWNDYGYGSNYYGYGYWSNYYSTSMPNRSKATSPSEKNADSVLIQPDNFTFGRRTR